MTRLAEAVALIAGVASLIIAAVQAVSGRPFEAWLFAAVVFILAGGAGRRISRLVFGAKGIEIEQAAEVAQIVQQVAAPDQPKDLKLTITHVYPMGTAVYMMDTEHALQITAVNTGTRPVGLGSLGIRYNDGRWSPFINSSPGRGNVSLPGVLQPEQFASVYNDFDGVMLSLREEGIQMTEVVARLTDGTERTVPVPTDLLAVVD